MTDTPKINTQAPERIWLHYAAEAIGEKPERWWEYQDYERRDLADARAAAAWIEGRDAAANETERGWETAPRQHGEMMQALADNIRDLQPPTDASAALDRLIAERVRVEVEARAAAAADETRMIVEQMRKAAEQTCQIVMDQAKEYGIPQMALGAKACRDGIRELKLDAARGSKEGQS
ncbi:hypothetical protein [Paracoccus sp. 22332]|uniref:hypothetical protein n=1 Tax=Paracoccus sp. 22332 TaxID=3453913 RepID=UPI003F828670